MPIRKILCKTKSFSHIELNCFIYNINNTYYIGARGGKLQRKLMLFVQKENIMGFPRADSLTIINKTDCRFQK